MESMFRAGGRVLLSGFYSTDLSDMHLVLEQLRFRIDEEITEDEWAAIAAARETP